MYMYTCIHVHCVFTSRTQNLKYKKVHVKNEIELANNLIEFSVLNVFHCPIVLSLRLWSGIVVPA